MDLRCLGPAKLERCRPTRYADLETRSQTLTHADTPHSDTKIHTPFTFQKWILRHYHSDSCADTHRTTYGNTLIQTHT